MNQPSDINIGGMQSFEALMPYRVREVLLVSSLYDAFVFQEDGQILEPLLSEYTDLNLRYAPRVQRVSTGLQAMELLQSSHRFDLVIITPHLRDFDPVSFAEDVKAMEGGLPVILLGSDAAMIDSVLRESEHNPFDYLLHWNGDSRLLVGIVKLIEDKVNFLHDSNKVGVRGILLVEDSYKFLSSYLPLLYAEIFEQSHRVLSDAVNYSHRLLRLRARPKVLLARDLNAAKKIYAEHGEFLLGVITDAALPRSRNGDLVEDAGLQFARHIRTKDQEMPILVQTSNQAVAEEAHSLEADFVDKRSPVLYRQMREFMLQNFGFGAFELRGPGDEVEYRANSMRELEEAVQVVSDESLLRHAKQNDFSIWLRARTEFSLANRLEPKNVDDFRNAKDLRAYLKYTLHRSRLDFQRGSIADFDRNNFDSTIDFSRIGGGSLGGKARGLAFINYLLRYYRPTREYRGVSVNVPPSVVITTELFDDFMLHNELVDFALQDMPDQDLIAKFVEGKLPPSLVEDLRAIVDVFDGPLAVRSSSLLEDSHTQPFAGIYSTFMLPNCDANKDACLGALCRAVKMVYASTYSKRAKQFIKATPYLHEEEKMGVVVQRLFGSRYENRFYPNFAGVLRSHNYYPFGPVKPDDGVCTVAFGLGRTVVSGEGGLRFCPKHPQVLPHFSDVDAILNNSQRGFYALDLDCEVAHGIYEPSRYEVETAEEDGTLNAVASTFSAENETISDGIARPGPRVITFAGVLKHDLFPLAKIAEELLAAGAWGLASPIEIEFAVDLAKKPRQRNRLALLQMRPMVVEHERVNVDFDQLKNQQVLVASSKALGNCNRNSIQDIVFVDPEAFDRSRSRETADHIAEWNAKLTAGKRPYLLIGPGRWGSSDPWLGIPVEWGQIAGVEAVVETGFKGMRVTPSEGSHFFHNMTAFHVGYMTVNPEIEDGELDFAWLRQQVPIETKDNGLRHIQLDSPLRVMIDGTTASGAIIIPRRSEGIQDPQAPPSSPE